MRIHGVRLHNILRYGEHHNIVEFDKGAARFLQTHGTIGKLEREALASDAPKYLSLWEQEKSPRILSIVGKTDSNRRESNASGKSSIFEAISYALFEKSLRESVEKNKDENRNKGKTTSSIVREVQPGVLAAEAFVELLFSVDQGLWLLRRGRKVSGDKTSAILRLDCLNSTDFEQRSHAGHRLSDTSETLKSLVKWDFETFCNSIMFGQFDSGQFLIGTDKVRKNIIINILNLGVVIDYLSECRVRKTTTQCSIDSLQAQLDVLIAKPVDPSSFRTSIETLLKQVDDLKKTCENLDKEISQLQRDENVARYQSAITEAGLKKQLLNQKQREEDGKISYAQSELLTEEQRLLSLETDLKNLLLQKNNTQNNLDVMRRQYTAVDVATLKQNLELVRSARSSKPTRSAQMAILQKIDAELQFAIGKIQNNIESIELQIKQRNVLNQSKQSIKCPTCGSTVTPEHLQSEIGFLTSELQRVTKDRESLEANIAENSKKLKEVQDKLTNIDQYISNESIWTQQLSDYNRLGESISSCEISIKSTEEAIIRTQAALDASRKTIATLKVKITEIRQRSISELQPYELQYKTSQELADSLSAGAQAVQQSIDRLTTERARFKNELNGKLLEIGRLETQAEEAEANGVKVTQVKQDLSRHQARLNRLKILEQMYGVDGVQTAIVDKYLPLLNSYLAEYIDALGGGKIHASVVTDGRRDGKVDLAITGQCSSLTTWLSGGERVKIRLALSLALGLLAFARSREVPEFICLDEVIAPVDDLTKDNIFALLKKLQRHFRTIMVVSHDKSVQENIPHEIVVNKIRGISRIEKQFWETA